MSVIDTSRWDQLLSDPLGLWYASDEIWPYIEGLFVNPSSNMSEGERSFKEEMLRYFATRLVWGMITLGKRVEFFNDDDRWTHEDGWKIPIDTVVIHHTATHPRLKYSHLNALGLLRLYCPIYKNSPAFQPNGNLIPISSGHFYEGAQSFVGYHWIVYNVGSLIGWKIQTLDDRYTGFHAGNYDVNCKSIGIAVVGNLDGKYPQPKTIDIINSIIAQYPTVKNIVGHKEVPRKDGKIIECPGNTWEQWKGALKLPS